MHKNKIPRNLPSNKSADSNLSLIVDTSFRTAIIQLMFVQTVTCTCKFKESLYNNQILWHFS